MSASIEEASDYGSIDARKAFENYARHMVMSDSFDWDLRWGEWHISSTSGRIADMTQDRWNHFELETGLSKEEIEALKPSTRHNLNGDDLDRTDDQKLEWLRIATDLVVRDPRAQLEEYPQIVVHEEESMLEGQASVLFGWSGSTPGDPQSGPGRLVSLIDTSIGGFDGNPGEEDFMYVCVIKLSYGRWKKYFKRRLLSQSSYLVG